MKLVAKLAVAAAFVAASFTGQAAQAETLLVACDTAFVPFEFKQGDQYVPYLGSLFLFIFTMNCLGVIPAFRSPTMTLSTTAALGITTFFMVQQLSLIHI